MRPILLRFVRLHREPAGRIGAFLVPDAGCTEHAATDRLPPVRVKDQQFLDSPPPFRLLVTFLNTANRVMGFVSITGGNAPRPVPLHKTTIGRSNSWIAPSGVQSHSLGDPRHQQGRDTRIRSAKWLGYAFSLRTPASAHTWSSFSPICRISSPSRRKSTGTSGSPKYVQGPLLRRCESSSA